jgi:glycosyltransferase A (GT-A) superfamily protein (DUF2064 family)
MTATIVVIAKRPVAGRVKTRLCPPLTPVQAADLAAAALRDTMSAVEDAAARSKVLCFDDEDRSWLRAGWAQRRQRDGGLDARLAGALAAAHGPALVVGMDTPQLTADLLDGFAADRFDACLGPTVDGGYWTIGLRDTALAPAALLGVPMSTGHTFAAQLRRLRGLGLTVQVLDRLIDVDTIADAHAVAALAPRTEFAATFAELEAGAA